MNNLQEVIERLEEKIEITKSLMEESIESKNNCESAMTSRHDTEREQLALKIDVYRELFSRYQNVLEELQTLSPDENVVSVGSVITLVFDDSEDFEKFVIVDTDGYGGVELDGLMTISKMSSVAKGLLGRKMEEVFTC